MARRFSVSLPEKLAEAVDRIARERHTTRSGLIADWAAEAERSRLESEMADGYRAMGGADRELAEYSSAAASVVMLRHPAP